jgi:hypothetical protein
VALPVLLLGLTLNVVFFGISVRCVPPSADEAIAGSQALDVTRGQFPLLIWAQPYQFPLECYLAAPVARWLPPTALGARLVPAWLSFLTVMVGLFALRRMVRPTDAWPGWLLMIIPSAYVLMLQVAYAMPQHSSMLLLTALIVLLLTARPERPLPVVVRAAGVGFMAGLVFSNHMLALPVLIMSSVVITMHDRWQRTLLALPAWLTGVGLGLVPFLLARWLHPGAHAAVGGTLPWSITMQRLWAPTCTHTLPGALGLNPCLYPDGKPRLDLFPDIGFILAVFWFLVLLTLAVLRLMAWIRQIRTEGRLRLEAWDFLLGIAGLGVLLFAHSSRQQWHAYRYLLLAAWCFPFLLAGVYAQLRGGWRRLFAGAAISLAVLNTICSVALMRQWAAPGFATRESDLDDLRPVLAELERQGIRHCFATHLFAYRLSFESGGRVLASQAYNERFAQWPLPHKTLVHAATNAAYVLVQRLPPLPLERFESDLATLGVACRVATLGVFRVYSEFRQTNAAPQEQRIVFDAAGATVSHNAAEASSLTDGQRASAWQSQTNQQSGMWLQQAWKPLRPVQRISLCYHNQSHGHAPALDILLRGTNGWEKIGDNLAFKGDLCDFSNGHPVYGDFMQTIRFDPRWADAVRVQIRQPNPLTTWMLSEVEVYFRTDNEPARAP